MVKKLISLILISVCLGDTLILKDKTEYTGTLIKFGNDEIIFRALPSAKMSINISDIQELKLWDGTKAFENGILIVPEQRIRQDILIAKKKLFLRDATICCSLIIILGLTAFFTSDFDILPSFEWPEKGP